MARKVFQTYGDPVTATAEANVWMKSQLRPDLNTIRWWERTPSEIGIAIVVQTGTGSVTPKPFTATTDINQWNYTKTREHVVLRCNGDDWFVGVAK